jgi:HAD superfamily hydrolase (TIGR01490 family)
MWSPMNRYNDDFLIREALSFMRLAIFDLDNTLLAGDSDHAWGEFLISKGLVDASSHASGNDRFYRQYTESNLDINEYVRFTLGPVLGIPITELEEMHKEFMGAFIVPMFLPKAQELIAHHKAEGDFCLVMSATNSFIAHPIADALKVNGILATDLQIEAGQYTGEIAGIPCFQEGKVRKLEQWINLQNDKFILKESVFFSDSINDLPLLKEVSIPVAVDPDQRLEEYARQHSWQIISLR